MKVKNQVMNGCVGIEEERFSENVWKAGEGLEECWLVKMLKEPTKQRNNTSHSFHQSFYDMPILGWEKQQTLKIRVEQSLIQDSTTFYKASVIGEHLENFV